MSVVSKQKEQLRSAILDAIMAAKASGEFELEISTLR